MHYCCSLCIVQLLDDCHRYKFQLLLHGDCLLQRRACANALGTHMSRCLLIIVVSLDSAIHVLLFKLMHYCLNCCRFLFALYCLSYIFLLRSDSRVPVIPTTFGSRHCCCCFNRTICGHTWGFIPSRVFVCLGGSVLLWMVLISPCIFATGMSLISLSWYLMKPTWKHLILQLLPCMQFVTSDLQQSEWVDFARLSGMQSIMMSQLTASFDCSSFLP